MYSSHLGSRDIEHLGSAHDDGQIEVLKAAARQRLAAGQGELDLGLEATGKARKGAGGGPGWVGIVMHPYLRSAEKAAPITPRSG